jgi:hypothetical protein
MQRRLPRIVHRLRHTFVEARQRPRADRDRERDERDGEHADRDQTGA